MGTKRSISILAMFILIILLLQIRLLTKENDKMLADLRESQRVNAIYVGQMSALQMVQNGIYITEIERDEYLKTVWDDYTMFGDK